MVLCHIFARMGQALCPAQTYAGFSSFLNSALHTRALKQIYFSFFATAFP